MTVPLHHIRKLGYGTYGTVDLVKWRGRRYARKVYGDSYCSSAIRELALLRSLSHPHIVKLEEVFFTGDKISALFELADGELLEKLSPIGNLDRIITAAHSLLSALRCFHERGLVHGDLSAPNLLVSDGVLKVADFGSTRRAGREGFLTQTTWWRAPEVIADLKFEPCIDMWSVGVHLYEWLFDEMVTTEDDESGMMTDILSRVGVGRDWRHASKTPNAPLPHRRRLPSYCQGKHYRALSDLLYGCLCVDDAKRWTVNQALKSQLFAGLVTPVATWQLRSEPVLPPLPAEADNEVPNAATRLHNAFREEWGTLIPSSSQIDAALIYIARCLYAHEEEHCDNPEDPVPEIVTVLTALDFQLYFEQPQV